MVRTTEKPPIPPAGPAGDAGGRPPAAAGIARSPQVIVIKAAKKKRGKKRYTRGSKDLQRLEYGLSKSSYRVADAVAEGIRTFYRRSDRSARRKKDGLVRDSLRNSARGLGDALREGSRAPYELARKVSTRKVWRRTRGLGRLAPFPLSLFLR